ncbi:MAG: M1 family aminopeptidase [Polyangiaceae bacterium]
MMLGNRRWAFSTSAFLLGAALATGCGGSDTGSSSGGGGASTTTTGGTGGSTGGTGGTIGGTGGTGGATSTAPDVQDILTTDLNLDLGKLEGTAKIVVWPAKGSKVVNLEVGGLTIVELTVDGATVDYQITDGKAAIQVLDESKPATIDVSYTFTSRPSDGFDGWMGDSGVSLIWPYFCSNLFPCNSFPDDGVTFTMNVTGYDQNLVAVYPTTTTIDSPSYMPGIAVGAFLKQDLGKTTAGTAVSAWYFAGQEADVAQGTAHLLEAIDYYEKTYGPYPFGKETGSVSANWGPGGLGGMEHHPFVHVASDDFFSEEVHAHEAAHAWYGDGVRIACWEDFMLSEGTVTYMAAHSLEKVGGPDIWPDYVDSLTAICTGQDVNTIALPSTCNVIDLFNDPLWSNVPYIKGACFYEDVADVIGQDKVDEALSEFFTAHKGGAARMNDMIAALEAKATADQKTKIETFKTEWLLTEACPADYATRCGTHQNP